MEKLGEVETSVSDQDLILLARAGDREAFGELWKRHARSGIVVARQFSSSLDADDLVAEAFARIYQRVLDGGGPDGAFRPYLYTTIRNLASRLGGSRREIHIEDIEDLSDSSLPPDPETTALDAKLTADAFRQLPERWQTVLWYTEVEGMDPHEVAPILGLSANGVAALAYRAREGLRTAWLQAHVSAPGTTADCRWQINHLAENARRSLTAREQRRFDAHAIACESCRSVAVEVDEVCSELGGVLLPLLLGTAAGGALLASVAPIVAAASIALPPVPAAIGSAGIAAAAPAAASIAGAVGASAVSVPIVAGAIAITAILGGGIAVVLQPSPVAPSSASVSAAGGSAEVATNDDAQGAAGGKGETSQSGNPSDGGMANNPTDPTNTLLPNLPVGPVPEHEAPGGLVGALIDLDLNGKGMPGATVSAQVAEQIYTTVVAANGKWAIRLTALPQGVGPITLKQKLVVLGIPVPLDVPLTLLSDTAGITVELLN